PRRFGFHLRHQALHKLWNCGEVTAPGTDEEQNVEQTRAVQLKRLLDKRIYSARCRVPCLDNVVFIAPDAAEFRVDGSFGRGKDDSSSCTIRQGGNARPGGEVSEPWSVIIALHHR